MVSQIFAEAADDMFLGCLNQLVSVCVRTDVDAWTFFSI